MLARRGSIVGIGWTWGAVSAKGPGWAATGVVGLLLIHQLGGVLQLIRHPVRGADYVPVALYVAAHRAPEDPVLVALPPVAYLALGGREGVIFVPGPADGVRSQRYTRDLDNGRAVDYWLGVDVIADTAGLCAAIAASPAPWLIVDEARLNADWAYGGAMGDVIRGLTVEVYQGRGGAVARRPAPPAERDPSAQATCARAQALQSTR